VGGRSPPEAGDRRYVLCENVQLKSFWIQCSEKPSTLIDTLKHAKPEFYPNIHRAVKVLLTMPVTSAPQKDLLALTKESKRICDLQLQGGSRPHTPCLQVLFLWLRLLALVFIRYILNVYGSTTILWSLYHSLDTCEADKIWYFSIYMYCLGAEITGIVKRTFTALWMLG
jgi:hypothetical protein